MKNDMGTFGPVEKRTGKFISFDGTPIYYEVRGTGKPLVLCYGIACLINHWTHQIRYFSQSYQTIVLDYRGHHRSGTPTDRSNLSIDAICRDIDGLLNHLEIEQSAFCGHSYGAMVLLRFYELYPERVANLILVNGFAGSPLLHVFGVDKITPLIKFAKDVYEAFPSALGGLWKAAVSNPLAIPLSSLAGGFNLNLTSMRDIEIYARGVAAMDLQVFITLFEEMVLTDLSSVLDRIERPTLVIAGDQDGVTPKSYQENMHRRIAGSEFLAVPYGSHCTQLDFPDFVNLRIEKFLTETGYALESEKPTVHPEQLELISLTKPAVRKQGRKKKTTKLIGMPGDMPGKKKSKKAAVARSKRH